MAIPPHTQLSIKQIDQFAQTEYWIYLPKGRTVRSDQITSLTYLAQVCHVCTKVSLNARLALGPHYGRDQDLLRHASTPCT
ncbi:hypothetical protein SFMTTN_0898 [Sulfuriferula multivorans]|uniref:Uncharacterized protein n=1 Tax=Sulfuriferula multivorans TaxID=1559896 RepID=A0A401JC03_9PROT|nr:hypothetical protein SFMTTN_0898 [Sulfuriferula multivorans]